MDRFTIFETSYMVALVFVLPVLAGCAPWLIPALRERLPPSGILGFTLWSVAAGIAHLGLTAAASASV